MEFLKEILGEELYNKFVEKINAYNGNEENKEKIKLANLGAGNYVSKDKYASLETTHNSKLAELEQANGLIAELQKTNKGNEELQTKIQTYDNQVKQLQAELEKTKLDAAIKVALHGAKALDVDYLAFKLNEEKAEFTLDENGKVKGLEEKIEGLKIKFPTQFESGKINKKIIENPLPKNDDPGTLTKAELLRKPYAERNKFALENPEAYREIMKN